MADVGRPTVMTPETIAKLESAFSNGATDLEACFIADISKDALYDYQKEHPEFSERKEALKNMIKYQAKSNIVKIINCGTDVKESLELSKWYLERRDKDFKPKSDVTSDDNALQPILVKFIDGNEADNRDTNRIQETI